MIATLAQESGLGHGFGFAQGTTRGNERTRLAAKEGGFSCRIVPTYWVLAGILSLMDFCCDSALIETLAWIWGLKGYMQSKAKSCLSQVH